MSLLLILGGASGTPAGPQVTHVAYYAQMSQVTGYYAELSQVTGYYAELTHYA